jgi:hypothetical protein
MAADAVIKKYIKQKEKAKLALIKIMKVSLSMRKRFRIMRDNATTRMLPTLKTCSIGLSTQFKRKE